MTTMKKLFALMLAVMMLLSVCAVAGAGTITVSNSDPSQDENLETEDYTAYKIFNVIKNGEAVVYTIDQTQGWFEVLFDVNGAPNAGNAWFSATKIPGEENLWQIIPNDDYTPENETAAKAAAAWLLENKGANTGIPLAIGSTTVDDGYYLVDSTLGTNLGLATTDFGMEIVEKNTYPGIDKQQKDEPEKNYGDECVSVAVGDTVYYQVTVTVPKTVGNSNIVVTDTMSAGLIFDGIGTVTTNETELVKDTDWMVEEGTDGAAFKITILPTENVKKLAGEEAEGTITFTFTATVDDAALLDTEKENKVQLTYSNFVQSDLVEYETYAAGAIKYDGATAKVGENGTLVPSNTDGTVKYLEGAEFELLADGEKISVSKHDDGYYYPDPSGVDAIVSDKDGKILIRGLDMDAQYQLKEIIPPAGYNLVSTPIDLKLVPDSNTVDAQDSVLIENLSGATLPETGGIGTTIFYVAGGMLVLLAVVLLVTKRRMGENN